MQSKNFKIILLILLIFFVLTGCKISNIFTPEEISESEFLMDTFVEIKAYGEGTEKVIDKSFSRMRKIEDKMSKSINTSEISHINKNAGQEWVTVSSDTYEVIKKAIHYAHLTKGKFDPTIGTLVSLWGIGTSEANVPESHEIKQALRLVNYKWVKLDNKNHRVKLEKRGMKLDLGAIAKGYAVDEASHIFENSDIKSLFINLGGNIHVIGEKPDGSSWKIGVQDPREERGSVMASVDLVDKTIVTSGNYERFFKKDGILYHHILDPETGRPTRNNLLSVSIITDNSFEADVISTSAFIMGKDKGMQLVEKMENVEAMFITDKLNVLLSSGLKGKIKILNSDFKLVENN